jgi:hypothetical protein
MQRFIPLRKENRGEGKFISLDEPRRNSHSSLVPNAARNDIRHLIDLRSIRIQKNTAGYETGGS